MLNAMFPAAVGRFGGRISDPIPEPGAAENPSGKLVFPIIPCEKSTIFHIFSMQDEHIAAKSDYLLDWFEQAATHQKLH